METFLINFIWEATILVIILIFGWYWMDYKIEKWKKKIFEELYQKYISDGIGSRPKVFSITEASFGTNERKSNASIVRSLTAGGHSGGHHSGMTLICDSGQGRKMEEREIVAPLRSNTGVGHGNYIYYGSGQDQKVSLQFSQTLGSGHYNQPKIYSMGNGKPNRSCIGSARVPEVGDQNKVNTQINSYRM